MARPRSTSGKSSRTSKEQPGVNSTPSVPVVNAVATPQPAAAEVRPETKSTPEPKKFEVLKTEPRKNVVPINLEDEIRRRAYELYQHRDPASGSEAEDWFTAECEVMQRYRQHSA
ncbi:MAG: DUF2934 domain-containing protein [Candidatus Sulfotelmatobacter sp.]|jgi:hypothetical protein